MATVEVIPDGSGAMIIVDGLLVCSLYGEAEDGEWDGSGMKGYYEDDGETTVLYDWDGKHVFTAKCKADWVKF